MADYRVRAFNTATASENKIHDNAVARRLGFRGGLVPGVDVYAYMTHPIVAVWGRAWLERGAVSLRLLKPVYDAEEVLVTASADGDTEMQIEVRNRDGEVCATARAGLAEKENAIGMAAYPAAPLPALTPLASPDTLAPGTVLGSIETCFRADKAADYLADVREPLSIYRDEGIAHPGYLLRQANYILAANVKLGPWIHVASTVTNFGVACDGDRIGTRGRVAAAYEKKGHRFVELDLLLVANRRRPLARVTHTAIYEPRQLRG
jgi:acyl dehydratase